MAKKKIWIGSQGPFLYEDKDYNGIETEGSIRSESLSFTTGSTKTAVLVSNSNKEVEEYQTPPVVPNLTTSASTDDIITKLNQILEALSEINIIQQ